ncbi:MAG: universal stress protein [Thermodesulfobacteriota bacterium]
MFKQILFPVDLTENSALLLPFVVKLADFCKATVHVLYVGERLKHADSLAIPHPPQQFYDQDLRSASEKKMKTFYAEQLYGLKNVERHVVLGNPDEEILKFAAEKQIDLIVMGTHGRKGMDRVLFGSVAENVTRNSRIPVMTVNPRSFSPTP